MKKYEILTILGNIYNCMENAYLKDLIVNLFNDIGNNKFDNLELLNLFNYDYTKYEYHNIKDSLELIFKFYGIKKYDVINKIRINNGLGLDNSYLNYLINQLDKSKFNTVGLEGLYNLLTDNNLIYNNIGLRVLIIRYLLNIDISNLNFIKLDNNRLNDNYKHLVYKNNKIKNYTKLYFIKDDIILSTLLHDNIINIIITTNDNINYCYGGDNQVIINDNQELDNLKDYQYRYKDKQESLFNMIRYLYYIVIRIKKQKETKRTYYINYKFITVNENNYKRYLRFFVDNNEYINTDKLKGILSNIEGIVNENDLFKSNDLEDLDKKTDINEYYLYLGDLLE